MGFALAGGAVLALALLVLAGLVRRRARFLSQLTARIEGDALEPRSTFPTAVVTRARHLRTGLAGTSTRLDWLGPARNVDGELGVTDREVVLQREEEELLRVPLQRVVESAFVRQVDGWEAGERLALLRIVWERGGERLATVFGIDAPWSLAEKLRREIHLRAAATRPFDTPSTHR